jgi:hypothetical protein
MTLSRVEGTWAAVWGEAVAVQSMAAAAEVTQAAVGDAAVRAMRLRWLRLRRGLVDWRLRRRLRKLLPMAPGPLAVGLRLLLQECGTCEGVCGFTMTIGGHRRP